MLPRALALLPLVAILAVAALPEPVRADEAGCNVRKLRAVSRSAGMLLRCQVRSVAAGDPADPECVTAADARLSAGFATAQADAECAASGEAGSVATAMHTFDDDLLALLVVGPDGAKCASGKIRVTIKRVRREVACRREAVAGGMALDPACVADVQSSLADAFARREAKMTCDTTGDAGAVGDLVSEFLSDAQSHIDGAFAPPSPSDLAAVVSGSLIELAWTAPDPGSGLTQARLLRALNAAPAGPTDPSASVVYEGPAAAADDDLTALLPDTSATPRVYHYAVYGCDVAFNCETAGSHTTIAPTVREALVAGGYVLHWRHASANVCSDRTDLGTAETTAVPDWWKSCDDVCETATARQLNASGLAESVEIGDAFATLGITVGRVLSSEFCRNLETAVLMDFGPIIEESQELTFFVYDEASRCSNTFAMLGEAPAPGTNTALIGHSGNACPPLSTLAWAEAAIYKPDGMGGATYIDRVTGGAWLTLP